MSDVHKAVAEREKITAEEWIRLRRVGDNVTIWRVHYVPTLEHEMLYDGTCCVPAIPLEILGRIPTLQAPQPPKTGIDRALDLVTTLQGYVGVEDKEGVRATRELRQLIEGLRPTQTTAPPPDAKERERVVAEFWRKFSSIDANERNAAIRAMEDTLNTAIREQQTEERSEVAAECLRISVPIVREMFEPSDIINPHGRLDPRPLVARYLWKLFDNIFHIKYA